MIVKLGGWELDLALLIAFELVLEMGSLLKNMNSTLENFYSHRCQICRNFGMKSKKKNKMGASA